MAQMRRGLQCDAARRRHGAAKETATSVDDEIVTGARQFHPCAPMLGDARVRRHRTGGDEPRHGAEQRRGLGACEHCNGVALAEHVRQRAGGKHRFAEIGRGQKQDRRHVRAG